MRLTDGQVRQTVAAMRMDAELKDKLAAQAIAGDMGARLVVFQAFKRFKGTHPLGDAAARDDVRGVQAGEKEDGR